MTEVWRPSFDVPGIVGDEAIMAFDMLLRPRHVAQRGQALGYLLERAARAWGYIAGGHERCLREELAPALALALSDENPAGPDPWRADPEHDRAIVAAVLRVAATGAVFYCRPLIDYLRSLAVRPAGGMEGEHAVWGARDVLSVTIREIWLDSATPGCLAEVAEVLGSSLPRAGWMAKAVLDTGAYFSPEAAAVLRVAWDTMPKEPAWRAALVGAGLVHHLDAADRARAVDLAVDAGAWAPVALDTAARAESVGPAGDVALDALLDLAERPGGRDVMMRAVLVIDDRLVRHGRASVKVTLPRAVEIAKRCYPEFARVHAALRRLG